MLAVLTALAAQDTGIKQKHVEYNKLTEFEEYVIVQKGTERPWTGHSGARGAP